VSRRQSGNVCTVQVISTDRKSVSLSIYFNNIDVHQHFFNLGSFELMMK